MDTFELVPGAVYLTVAERGRFAHWVWQLFHHIIRALVDARLSTRTEALIG